MCMENLSNFSCFTGISKVGKQYHLRFVGQLTHMEFVLERHAAQVGDERGHISIPITFIHYQCPIVGAQP